MRYQELQYKSIADPDVRDVFRRCYAYLLEVYIANRELPTVNRARGGGNWMIALALLCVVDGLAKYIYPRKGSQNRRFKQLLEDRILFGSAAAKKAAAKTIYKEFRCLLVHEIAVDSTEKRRPPGIAEPAVGKWDPFPKREQSDISKVEAALSSGREWPVFSRQPYKGDERDVLCGVALYARLKEIIYDMMGDSILLADAAADFKRVKRDKK